MLQRLGTEHAEALSAAQSHDLEHAPVGIDEHIRRIGSARTEERCRGGNDSATGTAAQSARASVIELRLVPRLALGIGLV